VFLVSDLLILSAAGRRGMDEGGMETLSCPGKVSLSVKY
jgi:hypothetical protein